MYPDRRRTPTVRLPFSGLFSRSSDRGQRFLDVIYLLAGVASGSMVAAANRYLSEPVTLALLYAIPVGLIAFRFGYAGSALASAVALALILVSPSAKPGSLFFDVLVLCSALVAVAGMLAAKIGCDRSGGLSSRGVDATTGLASRHAMVGALALELTRHARYSRPISVLLVGLEETERVQPRALAATLREVGRLVEGGIREIDVAGRYAERELLVVLPETRKEDAAAIAERLRAAIEGRRLLLQAGGETLFATVSVAAAGSPEDALSVEGLLESAEEALFEARAMGGNRVRQARKLQVAGLRR